MPPPSHSVKATVGTFSKSNSPAANVTAMQEMWEWNAGTMSSCYQPTGYGWTATRDRSGQVDWRRL